MTDLAGALRAADIAAPVRIDGRVRVRDCGENSERERVHRDNSHRIRKNEEHTVKEGMARWAISPPRIPAMDRTSAGLTYIVATSIAMAYETAAVPFATITYPSWTDKSKFILNSLLIFLFLQNEEDQVVYCCRFAEMTENKPEAPYGTTAWKICPCGHAIPTAAIRTDENCIPGGLPKPARVFLANPL